MSSYIDEYFIISFFLFFLYFILVATFGFFLSSLLRKKLEKRKMSLSSVLKCFALGLCIHLLYSTIIGSLGAFSFFTIYLPFILIDISFLIYFFKRNYSIRGITKFKEARSKLFLIIKQNLFYLLTLSIIFFMLYTMQMYFIWKRLPYPESDAYTWFKNIWFIHENGSINYGSIQGYPPGFALFSGSMISIIDNYYVVFFFLKYLPIFLSLINILVLFEISKKLFKRKVNIFFTLSIYLSFKYLFYRYQMPIPSTLATTLGFLFLLFLMEGTISHKILKFFNKKNVSSNYYHINTVILRGIIIAGIVIVQPLYGLFYLIFYLVYEFYIFIVILKFNKIHFNVRKYFIIKFIKTHLAILTIIILLLLPWYIATSIYFNKPLFDSFLYYFSALKVFQPLEDLRYIGKFFYDLAREILRGSVYEDINNFLIDNIVNLFNFTRSYDVYNQTIGTGIIIIAIGVILPINKFFQFNDKQKNIVRFIKFTFILTILSLLLTSILNFRGIPLLSKLNEFFAHYSMRLFEFFAGYWAILFVLSFNFIVLYFPRLLFRSRYLRTKTPKRSRDTRVNVKFLRINLKNKILNLSIIKKFLKKLKSIKKIPKKRFIKKSLSIPFIISIIFLSGFYYTINYGRIYYYNHFTDSQTDVVLFVGNYFHENQLEEDTTLLLQNQKIKQVYHLINAENLHKIIYSLGENIRNYTGYLIIKEFIDLMNITYVLFNLVFSDEEFQNNFYSDFNLLYRNEEFWVFAKLI